MDLIEQRLRQEEEDRLREEELARMEAALQNNLMRARVRRQ